MPAHKLPIIFQRKTLKSLLVWYLVVNILVSGVPFEILLRDGIVSEAKAATRTITQRVDWKAGEVSGLDTETKSGAMQLLAGGEWEPRTWRNPPLNIGSWGASYASDGKYIYVTPGEGMNKLMRYSYEADEWKMMADVPKGVYYGGDMYYLDGNLYVLVGGFQKSFYKYNIATNSWTELAEYPELLTGYTTSISSDGTDLYAIRGGTREMYFYDISANNWFSKPQIADTTTYGDSIYYNGFIYYNNNSNPNRWYKYQVSNGVSTRLTDFPGYHYYDVRSEIKNGYLYVLQGGAGTGFWRFNLTSETWETLATTPFAAPYGSAVIDSPEAGILYVFRGSGTSDWWKYDIAGNKFLGPTDAPWAVGYNGADLTRVGNKFYSVRGGSSAAMYEYDFVTGVWTQKANAPDTIDGRNRATTDGRYIYLFQGRSLTNFFRYDTQTDTWSSLAVALGTIGSGGVLMYPGSGDYIFASRGNWTRTWWRYSISGNSWDDAAATDLPVNVVVDTGAAAVTDGSNIYFQSGLAASRFFKFDVALNSWTELSGLPYSPQHGTDIAYDGTGKIYGLSGNWDTDVYVYDIVSNTWSRLPRITPQYGYDRGTGDGASIEWDGISSFYVLRGGSQYVLKFKPSSQRFISTGSWTSNVQDFKYVSSWNSVNITATTPGDSSVGIETRSSADGATWSNWQAVSGATINSPANRYFQVKATLNASTDHNQTPILDDVTIDYVGDTQSPINPSVLSALSQTVSGAELVSGNTYSYGNPYFSWSGAADSETSVTGYYVYFGSNVNADPVADGTWQTTTNYLSTQPMSAGSYYLRIRTKDEMGNVSAAWNAFTYVYTGIPSEHSITVSTTDEFNQGTISNLQPWNDELKLASQSSGIWLENKLTIAPNGISYGGHTSAYVASTNKLYLLRGSNSQELYSYDFNTDVWTSLATTPGPVYMGGGIIEGPDGYLYAMQGNNLLTFWRYSITENTWNDEEAADLPNTSYYGASMVYDGSRYIYAFRGNNDDAFWKYDTLSNVWSTLTPAVFGTTDNSVNNLVYSGADLAYDGQNTIYAIQGNTRSKMAAYNISDNSWSSLPDAPYLLNQDSSIAYDSTTNAIYLTAGNYRTDFFKFDLATSTWTNLSEIPGSVAYGSDMRIIGKFIYLTRGQNNNQMYKYRISDDSWLVPTRGIFGPVFYGSSVDTIGNKAIITKGAGAEFYMPRGNMSNDFAKYNYETGEVTKLANLPTGSYHSNSMVYVPTNNKLYYTSYGWQKLFVYDPVTDSWSEDDAPLTMANGYGATMVYDGSRYIYWARGQASNFYRFDTQGTPGSKWSTMANIPYIDNGGDMVYKNGYIYALRGGANYGFYRYDVGANTWSDPLVADVPTGYRIYNGGALTDGFDGYLYALRGENTTNFLRYSISQNIWEVLPSLPGWVTYGGSIASNGSNRLFAFMTGSNSFTDGLYNYYQKTADTSFVDEGSYISHAIELGEVYRFSNLRINYTPTSGSTMSVKTRTSSNGSNWEAWSSTTQQKIINNVYEYKINSTAKKHIQVQITVKSPTGIYSGVIKDFSINYVQDSVSPTNPVNAGFTAYGDASESAIISTDTWYPHSSPKFTWPAAEVLNGATDTATGSGVVGYYVYYGTNANADPKEVGVLQTTNSFSPSAMISGNTYRLRIRSKDDADNVSTETWEPFVYKFDNVVPTQPTDVAANPSGYTAINNFRFTWDSATDSASQISGYCYKTATTSGVLSADQCTNDTALEGIMAYKTGSNTLYVRSKDVAGNYSAYTTASFYYNSDSPSPVRNLSVAPSSNTSNAFAFSWDTPEVFYGSAGNLRYHYSVNALPTVNNVTETPLTYLAEGPFATLPGDNYLYVVAKDEAGNIDYGVYSSVKFTAETTAPGLPINMDIADVSVKATKSWKLAISWEQPEDVGSGVGSYQVYRSTDGVNFTKIAVTAGISYVDTGLTQVNYYYKVRGCDSANNCGAFGTTVKMYPDGKFLVAATLVMEPMVSSVTTKKATIDWSTNRTCDSKVAYGTEPGKYLDAEVASSVHVTSHTIGITNLAPGTTYYYVARWTDEDGNTGTSEEMSFTTLPAPSAKEVTAVNVGLDMATIQFTSAGAYKAKVVYGKTTTFGGVSELPVSSAEATYGVRLEGLEDGVKYYYRVDLYDIDGSEYMGDTYSFETLPRPKVSNIKLQQVKGTATSTVLVTWMTNTPTSSIATYYPSSSPSLVKDDVNIVLTKSHRALIKGLSSDTAYTLLIKGRDKGGNEAISDAQTFTTAFDSRAPEISNLNTELTIQGNGEEATAQVVISWETDELATSQVIYGDGSSGPLSNKTQVDNSQSYTHLVVIPNLVPSKVYHFKALSSDKASNVGESLDSVIITPKATQSALNLVVGNLSQAFGFLGGLVGSE